MSENRKQAAASFFHHRTMSDIRRYILFLANLILFGCLAFLLRDTEKVAAHSLVSFSILSATFWISEAIRYTR